MARSRHNCYRTLVSVVFILVVAILFLPNAVLYCVAALAQRGAADCDFEEDEVTPFAVMFVVFLIECLSTASVVLLSSVAPLLPRRYGDAAAPVRVVIVHGLAQSRGAVSVLAHRLGGCGYSAVCFSFRSWSLDVPTAADNLRRLLKEMQEDRRGQVHIIGFGVGGVIARCCVRRHQVPGVHQLVTLGTAHLGTRVAPRHPSWLAQFRPEARLFTQLGAADRSGSQFEATALQTSFDATILPAENSHYPSALNVVVRDCGHFTLLFSRRVFDLIRENLTPN